jgi:hypothetical protein
MVLKTMVGVGGNGFGQIEMAARLGPKELTMGVKIAE